MLYFVEEDLGFVSSQRVSYSSSCTGTFLFLCIGLREVAAASFWRTVSTSRSVRQNLLAAEGFMSLTGAYVGTTCLWDHSLNASLTNSDSIYWSNLSDTGISRIYSSALICFCYAGEQIGWTKAILVDSGQRWVLHSCQMVAMLYNLEDLTYHELYKNVSPVVGIDCTLAKTLCVVLGTVKCDMVVPWLLFLLSFMPLRVFQRWPYCVLDLDVFNIFYGEMGPPARWYALLCPSKTGLCQWG